MMVRLVFKSANPSVSITVTTPPVITAPAAIWVEATDHNGFATFEGSGSVYDGAAHEIYHVWTVRGQPMATYDVPRNMIPQWNNPNIAYGQKVMFRFTKPDDYIIDLWAVDSKGVAAVAETATIKVVQADTEYPGARTICYSEDPNENWATEKANCRRVTSWDALQGALASTGVHNRVLFKRGQTITPTSQIAIDSGRDLSHVGTWDSGEKPRIVSSERIKNGNLMRFYGGVVNDQLTIENIDFRGSWDSTREVGFISPSPVFWRDVTKVMHYHIHGCDWDGYDGFGATTKGDAPSAHIAMTDCAATNWCNYAVFVGGGANNTFAALGCRFTQHVDALNGALGKGGMGNQHGPIRISRARSSYLSCMDLFARGGWSGGISNVNGFQEPADQPCLRAITSGDAGDRITTDRMVCEGGYHQIKISSFGESETVYPGNNVLDRTLCIGSAKSTSEMIYVGHGGTTVRNTVGFIPATPARQSSNPPSLIRLRHQNDANVSNYGNAVSVYQNTVLNLRSTTSPFAAVIVAPEWTDFIVENNLAAAPNTTPEAISSPTVDQVTPIPNIRPRFKGIRFNFSPIKLVPGNSALPNEPLLDGESFVIPYDQITDEIVGSDPELATATHLAYWQQIMAESATAGYTPRHAINPNPTRQRYSELNEIAVTFEAEGVQITNNSGETWQLPTSNNAPWLIRLDRSVNIPAMDESYGSPENVPLLRPASNVITGGRSTPSDFMLRDRNGTKTAGALLS